MKYVKLGKTGLMVSAISFGGIPIQRSDAKNTMEIVDKMEELGINYIDTARGYTVSEGFLGEALLGRRDKFILATKSMARDYDAMKKDIDISLANLKTSYIDIYQLHNIKPSDFELVFGPNGAYKALKEAMDEGKIGYIGATAHGIEGLEKLVTEHSDEMATLMFPYNIVEIHGTNVLKAARAKGIGTIAMKPLAGGNLDDYELALKFIADSETCDISIPGMGSVEEVIKNAEVCDNLSPLTENDWIEIQRLRLELGNKFCRRCGYCAPCTVGIDIPSNFLFVNYLRKYGLAQWASERYASLKINAADCIGCGECEKRCPYELPIRDMLKAVVKDFADFDASQKK
ncbi:MAG: aldo/keto reductase [Oscillospiraceae bacterium]